MWRTDSLEKTLMPGKNEAWRKGHRGWDGWMASLTWWTRVWASSGGWLCTGKPSVLQSTGSDTTEQLNWTELRHPETTNSYKPSPIQIEGAKVRDTITEAQWNLSLLRGQELCWWSDIILVEIQPKASTQPRLIFPLACLHHRVAPLGGTEQVNNKRAEVKRTSKFSFLGSRTEW